MKFVYVLISNPDDYLGEKLFISIFSLRRFHSNDNVEIYTDETTIDSIPETFNRLKNLGAEIKIETVPFELNQVQRSRFLKTSLRQRVKGDFIFIDIDTVIAGDLRELESIECDMALALQHDCMDDYEASKKRVVSYNKSRKINKKETYGITKFFNSGVILYKDTPTCHEICKTWHSFWLESSTLYGWNPDQTDLDRTNALLNNKITILDGKFNCQLVGFRYAMAHLSDCKIIHYFNNPKKLSYLEIKQPQFLNHIRMYSDINKIEATVDNLKQAYVKGLSIMENSQFVELKKHNDLYKDLISIYTYPIRYPISKLINKSTFLRKQVDLLKNKLCL